MMLTNACMRASLRVAVIQPHSRCNTLCMETRSSRLAYVVSLELHIATLYSYTIGYYCRVAYYNYMRASGSGVNGAVAVSITYDVTLMSSQVHSSKPTFNSTNSHLGRTKTHLDLHLDMRHKLMLLGDSTVER